MGTRGQEETHDKCNSAIPRLVASRAQGAVTLPCIIASSGHGSEISTQDIYNLQYLHSISTIFTVSTHGTGWSDASPQDHQLAEVRVDGSMSSAGWSNRFPLEIRAQVDIE